MGEWLMPAASSRPDATQEVLLWGGLLAALAVLAAAGLLLVRRWYRSSQGRQARGEFTVESLEQMRRAGQISVEEFRRLRRQALGVDAPFGPVHNSHLSGTGGDVDGDSGPRQAGCDEREGEE